MSVEEAVEVAAEIGYPVVLRPAYTLGGTGGGFADNEEQPARDDAPRPVPFARTSGARREEHQGIQGDRVRGDARSQRHGHQHLLHGEHRPRGRPYGRLDRRGAVPDAHQQGVPDAARQRPEDHPRVEDRRRLQRAVRTRPPVIQILPDRGESPCVALLGPRIEGQRLSDRARYGQGGRGSHPRRDHAGQYARRPSSRRSTTS